MFQWTSQLDKSQRDIVEELHEAAMDFSLGSKHEGACELESGIKRFVHPRNCHLCRAAEMRRSARLEAAANAAGPVLRRVLK